MNTSPTAATASSPVSQVADRAHEAVDRAAGNAAPMIEKASGAAHRTIERAADIANPAVDWVSDSGRQLAHRSSEAVDTFEGYVRQRPLTSLVAAAALGYFAGKLTR